jgi:hypothetical protein
MASRSESPTHSNLSTPPGAAIAGIVFALLLSASIVLLRLAIPNEAGVRVSDPFGTAALALVPFAGIAFLWFIGVLRDYIGSYEDRFFATVLLGSGLLFIAMLFIAASVADGLVTSAGTTPTSSILLGRQIAYSVLNIYTMRMAAVFMISTSTILLRTGILPRWLTYVGYAFALVLLVALSHWEWIMLLFPLWVLFVSVAILVPSLRASHA